ncbi:hypothetical protein, partial [Trebonia kvetii]|uniref:hypothetical protein n=1 Tax=Trebonia kvetii TaxID=2480626 RepID=UPI001C9E6824
RLLAGGILTRSKARLVAQVFEPLDEDEAARAEALIAGELAGKSYPQVERLAWRAALAVAPDVAERRRSRAERCARVTVFREQAGTVGLSGRDLPAAEALAGHANVAARAAVYAASGAFPGQDASRLQAQAYLDLLGQIPAADRIAFAAAAGSEPPGEAAPHGAGRGSPQPPGGPGPDTAGDDGDEDWFGGDDGPGPGRGDGGGDGDGPGDSGGGSPAPLAGTGTSTSDVSGSPDTGGDDDDHPADDPDDDIPDPGDDYDDPADDSGDDIPGPGGDDDDHILEPGGDDDDHPADDPDDDIPGPADDSDDDIPDLGGDGGGLGGQEAPGPPSPPLAEVTVPLATLQGKAERAGDNRLLGPLDPALARQLAAAAANSPHSRWEITIVDEHGYATGHSIARPARGRPGRPQPPGPGPRRALGTLPARVTITVTEALLRELAAQAAQPPQRRSSAVASKPRSGAPPGDWELTPSKPGSWALTLPGGRHLTVRFDLVPTHACDHRYQTSAYQPGDRLRRLIQVRDHQCTFPTCSRAARESDFEHAIPYDKGGTTDACNAGAR